MAEELGVRTPVVQSSQSIYQCHGSATQSLWYVRFPPLRLFRISGLGIEGSTHGLVNLFFAQCVVLEGHGGLSAIDLGSEHIV
jgi:hypothetical protein